LEHNVLSSRIAGEPPARLEELSLEFFSTAIDFEMVVEILNHLRAIGLADNQFETRSVGSCPNLINEVLAPSMEAP